MNRRHMLFAAGAALAIPQAGIAAYAPDRFVMDTWRAAREGSDLVIYNFRASWSFTCDMKAELLDKLICNNGEYARLRIIEVDWDTFGPSQMAQRLKIRRHSTLIILRGRDEVARVENQPFAPAIERFLNTAVAAL